jgi:arylsulfatase A-like enzyme
MRWSFRCCLTTGFACVVLVALLFAESVRASGRRPNIIVIMADDISAREFPTYGIPNPSYGDEPCTTPVMQQMRDQGIQFKHAWATPLCHPSRGMILTGRYAHRTGWWSNEFSPREGEPGYPLYESHQTLGQITKRAEYTTQFVGKWQLGGTREGYAFDEYVLTPGPYPGRAPLDKKPSESGRDKASYYWNSSYTLVNHPDFPESLKEKGQSFKTTWADHAADIELKYIGDFMRRKTQRKQPFFVYWPAHLGHSNWDFEHDAMGYPGVPPMDAKLYPGTKTLKTTAPDGSVVEKTPPGTNYHVQYLDYCLGLSE